LFTLAGYVSSIHSEDACVKGSKKLPEPPISIVLELGAKNTEDYPEPNTRSSWLAVSRLARNLYTGARAASAQTGVTKKKHSIRLWIKLDIPIPKLNSFFT